MSKLVTSATSELAVRTSRRGFLGRSGTVLLGLVGGSAVVGAAAKAAFGGNDSPLANCDCGHGICASACPNPYCNQNPPQAYTCYACPTCSTKRCCCTGVTC